MKKLFTGLSLALSMMMAAQKAPAKKSPLVLYSYETFGCDVKGYFDSSKYKKEEIDGTYQLVYSLSGSPFSSLTVFNTVKLDKVRSNSTQFLQQAEKEYQQRKGELNALKLIDRPLWKKQYAEAVQVLENEYQLRKEILMGYSDPQSLRKSIFYNTCKEYIDAMTTKDPQQMYSVWKGLSERNYSGTKEVFTAQWNDQRKDDYALMDLMNAFRNCASNSFRPKADENGTLLKAFDEVFIKLKRDCDQP